MRRAAKSATSQLRIIGGQWEILANALKIGVKLMLVSMTGG